MPWSLEEHAYRKLSLQTDARIVFLIFDGLGDLPGPNGLTPLEAAQSPVLDRLAAEGACGHFDPVAPGITPGSGPGHLGLFGYDPLRFLVGRGVLAALGIDFPLEPVDVAARFNYCTLDGDGRIVDRRAGRISTEENQRLTGILDAKLRDAFGDVKVFIRTVSEHRGLLVLRGEGLGAAICDTDPQATGVPPIDAHGDDEASERTASIVREIVARAGEVLAGEPKANGILLRGFDRHPNIPSLSERFKLRPVCIAQYPMYRGLARLVGMDMPQAPAKLQDLPDALGAEWEGHDFFFLHVKYTDKAGEDGDFERKVGVIEEVDRFIPRILDLGPDVVVVSADHSTPASLKAHSWHPVPTLLWAPGTVRPDNVDSFGERACIAGGLGRQRLINLLPLALAHAHKFQKFGA
ncbi:MAG: 2,3-bisphosphoglycerate-independent phosphoglycerate mutase [Acidobacteria bacterium]|nr:2,3-bisphosphoglycerate-independent phosphoglycerate mutase [Acidobacteriota bacterium]